MMTVQEALKENDQKFEKLKKEEMRADIVERIAAALGVISGVSFVAHILVEYPSLANTCTFYICSVSVTISAIMMALFVLPCLAALPYRFELLQNERRDIEKCMEQHIKYYN